MTRIIIQRIQGSRIKDLIRLIYRYRAPIVDHLWNRLSEIIEVDDDKVADILRILNASPLVKYAEVDELLEPEFGSQQLRSQWYLSTINAPDVWERTTGNGQVIAVLDSGVDSKHPDFKDGLVPGYNVNGTYDTEPNGNAHGTQVAGCAAANTIGTGVRGVAYKAKIQPVKVSNRTDGQAYISDLAKGLNWVAQSGKARVANLSYAASSFQTIQHAARTLRSSSEGLTFISSGNAGQELTHAWSPDVIVVGATDSADSRAWFSNYGTPVDLTAPGASITTTGLNGAVESVSGTSFSSPIAAACAALIMSYAEALTATEVEKILLSSTRGNLKIADVEAAINSVNVPAPTPEPEPEPVDVTPPTVRITSPVASETISGDVIVNVHATDDIEVKHVDLYINGVYKYSDDMPPYDFLVDTTELNNGVHSITAEATDHAGNKESFTVVVNVENAPPVYEDMDPPIVMITGPDKLGRWRTTFTAQAFDDSPIKKMEMIIGSRKTTVYNTDKISMTVGTFWRSNETVTVLAWDEHDNMGKVEETISR